MELLEIEIWRVILANRVGAAGKYDTFYGVVDFGKMVERMDLAVNIELPDTARDKLGKL